MIHSLRGFTHDTAQQAWLDAAMRGADWRMPQVPADKISDLMESLAMLIGAPDSRLI